MSLRSVDRRACEELAAAPGTEFEGVQRFLDANAEPRLLALEALFRSLRDIPLSVSEAAVGAAKLAWWQQELARASEEGSQHPVVRALLDADALSLSSDDEFTAYLHALVMALQEDLVEDVVTLRRQLGETVGREARLMVGMGIGDVEPLVTSSCAARLLELLRTLSRPNGEHRWLPLDLVARHGFRSGEANADRAGLVRDLAEIALDWRRSAPIDLDACTTPETRFLALRDALVGRRLTRAARRPARWLRDHHRLTLGDVLATWRCARRFGPAPTACSPAESSGRND